MKPDGTGVRTLTTPPTGQCDFKPAWSPDGSSIVFTRGQLDVKTDLWIVNAGGTGLRRLTTTVPTPSENEVRIPGVGGIVYAQSAHIRGVALAGPSLAVLVG